jgi:glutamyl-tRNA reductase
LGLWARLIFKERFLPLFFFVSHKGINMSKPVIGFIGVGFMGAGMAKNLVTKGYALVIMGNKNREPVERLKALGATEATSAKELAMQ